MDIRKLQRAIVDGLEDVKAQNIAVFNTEHLSPLFERVIVASGTSNRQTKALASSVRETVKSRGMEVLRTEGEENGEWIIVDCGAAVCHVMQPAIREYYRLEEIWGGKAVKMKIGGPAARGLPKASSDEEDEAQAPSSKGAPTRKAAGKGAPTKKAASRGARAAVADEAPAPKPSRQAAAKKAPARKPASPDAAKGRRTTSTSSGSAGGSTRRPAAGSSAAAAVGRAPARKTASGPAARTRRSTANAPESVRTVVVPAAPRKAKASPKPTPASPARKAPARKATPASPAAGRKTPRGGR
jgi:ribosome-associated protein